MNERELFTQAIAIQDEAQRAAFVEAQCSGEPELRERLTQLLSAHESASDFLENPSLSDAQDKIEEVMEAFKEQPADSVAAARPLETSEYARVSEVDDEKEGVDLSLEFLQPYLSPPELAESRGRIGHYEILEVIGKGGCGIVLRGYDTKLHRTVAIKWMAAELAQTSPARKRFLREARAAAAVAHQNVVRIYAVEEQPVPHLVMEFIAGKTLQHQLEQAGPFDLDEVNQLGLQIAAGLAASHSQGLIHRDVKPSNILLEEGTNQVKLTDFGLARAADDASLTQSGMISGTPLYMSPEQAQGQRVDERSDLFSLGSVLYAMCTGRPPFRAGNAVAILRRVVEDRPRPIAEIIHEIPEWMVKIIEKLHAKNPDERYANARDLIADWTRKADLHANRQRGGSVARGDRRISDGGEEAFHSSSAAQKRGNAKRLLALAAGLAVVFATVLLMNQSKDGETAGDAALSRSLGKGSDDGHIENLQPAFNDFREAHGLTETQLTQWVEDLEPGYEPTWFSPRRHVDTDLYDIVAVNRGLPDREPKIEFIHNAWQPDGSPNDETCGAYIEQIAKAGRSHHYAVLRALNGTSVGILSMLIPDEFEFWFTERDFITEKIMIGIRYERQNRGVTERFMPLSLNVGNVGDAINHEVILGYLPYVDCNWHWSLTEDQLLFRMNHYKEKGWRPHLISTNSGTSETLFTAVFVLSELPSPWSFTHDISQDEYEAMLISNREAGGRPRCVNSWVEGDRVRYSVIWDLKP